MRLKTNYQKLDDIDIAYTEYGEGENLLLLHGNSGSKKTFFKCQTEYFKDYHTYALDSRGHGESVSDDDELSIERISQDVVRFCKAKGIAKAKVIGYSDGGNIALFLALNAADVFERIIAISPNYLVSGTVEKWLRIMKRFSAAFSLFGMRKMKRCFALMLSDIGLSREDLQKIRANIEIIYAENDMIKEDHILDIHTSIPGSKIKKISGCSHLTILESEAAIAEMARYIKGE